MNKVMSAITRSVVFFFIFVAASVAIASSIGGNLTKGKVVTYAVLDTAVNRNSQDGSVTATILEGAYKGAKLNGKLAMTQNSPDKSGNLTLHFVSMKPSNSSNFKKINAYAIDENTARTALAYKVDNNYLKQNGIILAVSLIQAFAIEPSSMKQGKTVGILFMPA